MYKIHQLFLEHEYALDNDNHYIIALYDKDLVHHKDKENEVRYHNELVDKDELFVVKLLLPII